MDDFDDREARLKDLNRESVWQLAEWVLELEDSEEHRDEQIARLLERVQFLEQKLLDMGYDPEGLR